MMQTTCSFDTRHLLTAENGIAGQTTQYMFRAKGKQTKLVGCCCRLKHLQGMAGAAGPDEGALNALIEGDFDPEEYDKRMAAAFGDQYYKVSARFPVVRSRKGY